LLFTNAELKKVDSWHSRHVSNTCQPCLWQHWHRLPDINNGSTNRHVFVTFICWFSTIRTIKQEEQHSIPAVTLQTRHWRRFWDIGGAHMSFSECTDTILNWTEMTWTVMMRHLLFIPHTLSWKQWNTLKYYFTWPKAPKVFLPK